MKIFGKEFGRNKSANADVPADLQQYYSTNPGAGTWVKRIALFVVVLALLVGGGVWLFNALSSRDGSQTASNPQKATEQRQQATEDRKKADQNAAAATAEAQRKAEEARKKAAAEAEKKAAENRTRQQAAAPPAGGQGAGTTNPQTNTSQLPNSGPGTLAVSLFAGATALGALVHSLVLRRRTQ